MGVLARAISTPDEAPHRVLVAVLLSGGRPQHQIQQREESGSGAGAGLGFWGGPLQLLGLLALVGVMVQLSRVSSGP